MHVSLEIFVIYIFKIYITYTTYNFIHGQFFLRRKAPIVYYFKAILL